jgi:transcriptional regulator
MVLQVVATFGPTHGYAIAERLLDVSSGTLQLNMGTLYPCLIRLEQRGLIRAKWQQTESHRRARFYTITAAGTKQLQTERADWVTMAAIIQRLLEGQA